MSHCLAFNISGGIGTTKIVLKIMKSAIPVKFWGHNNLYNFVQI
jgi:hypothetical protein